ncbi:MAG: hypothetical protein WC050_04540 [Candidatus Paceibacterota bacterium]
MKGNAWIWWLVAAIVIIGGGYWLWQQSASPSTDTNVTLSDDGTPAAVDAVEDANAQSANEQGAGTGVTVGVDASAGTAASSAIVTYNGSSFSPATVTIKKGGSVTFTSTAGNMWVASAAHPAHTGYDGTSRTAHCVAGYTGAAPFDQCAAGTSYTFTFNSSGTWPYHDHINASAFGKVVVVQ